MSIINYDNGEFPGIREKQPEKPSDGKYNKTNGLSLVESAREFSENRTDRSFAAGACGLAARRSLFVIRRSSATLEAADFRWLESRRARDGSTSTR
jgi:hypothetical protein